VVQGAPQDLLQAWQPGPGPGRAEGTVSFTLLAQQQACQQQLCALMKHCWKAVTPTAQLPCAAARHQPHCWCCWLDVLTVGFVIPFATACSKRAFIVTDPPLFEMGMANEVVNKLLPLGIQCKTFTNVEPDPTLAMVERWGKCRVHQGVSLACPAAMAQYIVQSCMVLLLQLSS